jgi:hypothetical protein
VEASHSTYSGTSFKDAKAIFTHLFSQHRSLVKVIQAYKTQGSTSEISTKDIVPLLIELATIGDAFDTEEDIVGIIQRFRNLREVADWLESAAQNGTC